MAEETRTTPAAIDESLLEQELTRVKHQNGSPSFHGL